MFIKRILATVTVTTLMVASIAGFNIVSADNSRIDQNFDLNNTGITVSTGSVTDTVSTVTRVQKPGASAGDFALYLMGSDVLNSARNFVWENKASPAVGVVLTEFDLIPQTTKSDITLEIRDENSTAGTGKVLINFRNDGSIQYLNQVVTGKTYAANNLYHVSMQLDLNNKKLNVTITENGAAFVQITDFSSTVIPFTKIGRMKMTQASISTKTIADYNATSTTPDILSMYVDNFRIVEKDLGLKPTTVITTPKPNAIYTTGSSFSVGVNYATIAAKGATKVEYFNGATSLGVVTSSPFTLNIQNAVAGDYIVTAVATYPDGPSAASAPMYITVADQLGDNKVYDSNFNNQSIASPLSRWPLTEILSFGVNPKGSGASDYAVKYDFSPADPVNANANMYYENTAGLSGLVVNKVDMIPTDINSDRTIQARAKGGSYLLIAKLTGDKIQIGTNEKVFTAGNKYTIQTVIDVPNNKYGVTILENDLPFMYCDELPLALGTFDFIDRIKIQMERPLSTQSVTYIDNFWVGSRTMKAKPTVSITAPANNDTFSPGSLELRVNASSQSGTITQVEYFNNGVSLGVSTIAPFKYLMQNPEMGTYVITAKATDNTGAVSALSLPVTFVVAAYADELKDSINFNDQTKGTFSVSPTSTGTYSQIVKVSDGNYAYQFTTGPATSSVGASSSNIIYKINNADYTLTKPVYIEIDMTAMDLLSQKSISVRDGVDKEFILATIKTDGNIDFLNNSTPLAYTVGTTYSFRFVINTFTNKYDLMVTSGSTVLRQENSLDFKNGTTLHNGVFRRLKIQQDTPALVTSDSVTLFDNLKVGFRIPAPIATEFSFAVPGLSDYKLLYNVPLTSTKLSFKFSENMSAASLASPTAVQLVRSLEGVPVDMTGAFDQATNTYDITFAGKLFSATKYDIKFSSGIETASGAKLANGYSVSFVTANNLFDIIGSTVTVNNTPIYSVSELRAGDTLKCIPVIKNGTAQNKNSVAILAVYSKNNKLLAMSSKPVTINANSTNDTTELFMKLNSIDSDCTLRLFVWDSLNSMSPLVFPKSAF